MWLRVPFFLVTALTYGYLTTNARQARCRADAAEAVLALKTTFLATLSHEVRTPLNVIVGYTDMLREGLLGELVTAQREALDKMSTHAFELLELVDRTLKASRLESGGMPVHLGEVHVDAVLEEVQLAVSRHCKADVDLSLRTQAGIPPVVTDRLKLKEIVANLVTNALKYTDKGAVTVDARWAARERCVEIMVRDTGLGIRPEERQAIFEPFTRAREAVARRERPDLVLMDVRLAEGDGRAAARELKAAAETAAIPIVAVTALALEGDREACLAAGCDDYLSKPFRPRELLAKVRTLLGPR